MNKLFGTIVFLSVVFFFQCKEETFYPKPLGFHRIDFPENIKWNEYDGDCNFKYKYPNFAVIKDKDHCNQDIYFPQYNAVLKITSVKFDNPKDNLFTHSEYSRKLAYEHKIKADAINEKLFVNDSARVYGVAYDIVGNVASNYQFYITDSTDNFYRGSLYFNQKPNIDSLRPVLNFLKKNINSMIESFDWKE